MRRLTAVAFAAAVLGMGAAQPAAAAQPDFVPGELLVRFKPAIPGSEVRALLAENEQVVDHRLEVVPGLREVDLPAGTSVAEGIDELEAQPEVLFAEPNWRRESFAIPNDPRFADQWSLRNTGQTVFGIKGSQGVDMRADGAWDLQTGSAQIPVAVVDTGLSFTHPDLDGNTWANPDESLNGIDDDLNGKIDDLRGWDFAAQDNDPTDSPDFEQGHGTAISGIIAAEGNNGFGITGINWRSAVMPLRAPLDVSAELDAFRYAAGEGARVLNYSAGSPRFSFSEQAAIDGNPGTLFVVASGNSSMNVDERPIYPCAYLSANLVCVGSTDEHDQLSFFSNYGSTAVDLAAPGENIVTTYPAGALANDLKDRFGDRPIFDRWDVGGKGSGWRSTRALHRGFSIADSKGKYRNGTNSWIRSRPIDLSTRRRCLVSFFLKLRTQRHRDYLILDLSRDGDQWKHRRRFTGKRTGTQAVSIPRRFSGQPAVSIRLRMKSDGSGRGDGAYVDDFQVSCETTDNTYVYLDGTSFSAPMVAGAAALALAQNPTLTPPLLRAKLLASVDPLPSLAGKFASGGRLNLAKVAAP